MCIFSKPDTSGQDAALAAERANAEARAAAENRANSEAKNQRYEASKRNKSRSAIPSLVRLVGDISSVGDRSFFSPVGG